MLESYMELGRVEAGCDEAGRGCLAGPVSAAAVIMPTDYHHPLLNDSKKMSEKAREILRFEIENNALGYAVVLITPEIIDEINILKASILGMHRALDKLKIIPDHILVDGNRFITYKNISHTCIIKGDGRFVSIAAASVLAKTYRDEHMMELDKQYPAYGWRKNKGYPTVFHRQKIGEIGICNVHRKSFHLTNSQLQLGFEHADSRL